MNELRAVYFFSDPSEEIIIIAGKSYIMPAGSILKFLIETENHFWKKVKSIASEIVLLCEKDTCITVADLIAVIQKAKSIRSISPAPELLTELMLYLPAHTGYADAAHKEDSVQLSALELEEFKHKIFSSDVSDHERDSASKRFYQRRDDMGDYPAITSRWIRWFNYLMHDGIPQNLAYELHVWQDCSEMLSIAKQYSQHMHDICVAAETWKSNIEAALLITDCDYLKRTTIIEEMLRSTPHPFAENDARNPFRNNSRKDSCAYAVTTLPALIATATQAWLNYGLALTKCEFCGGYFFTRKSNRKYCGYPNSFLENKTCQDGAPKVVRQRKGALMPTYDKCYNTYRHWISRTITQDDKKMYDTMEDLQRYLMYVFGKRKAPLAMQMIEDEIETIFTRWDENAKKKLDEFIAGKITEDDCKAALVLPSVEARSPLLASWDGESIAISENDLNSH